MATRSQAETQITWGTSGASTTSVAADGAFDYSNDFTLDGDMIGSEYTVEGNSAGTASDDILEVHYQIKKDPDNSNSGTPDTYDTIGYSISLDCSDGNDNQQTVNMFGAMAGDILRFGCKNDGTNAITVGIRVTEDKIAL